MPNDHRLSDDDYIDHAVHHSGLGADALLDDMETLRKGPGRLTIEEYVDLGLYDWTRYDLDARRRFISNSLHWEIVARTCDLGWFAATEDKFVMSNLLRASGIPTPPILAVADAGVRIYPGTRKIRDRTDLVAFLSENGGRPFFGKKLRGMEADQAFLSTRSSTTEVEMHGGRIVSTDDLFGLLQAGKFILQPVVRNHAFFEDYTRNLATLRAGVFVYDNLIKLAFLFLRVPGGDNVVDLFKAPGNIAASLDSQTGRITGLKQRQKIGTTDLGTFPGATRTAIGEALPFWPEVVDIMTRVAGTFAPVRFQSMDIALTQTGPVLIEVNTGGSFMGAQLANGLGLLQPNLLHFLQCFSVDLNAIPLSAAPTSAVAGGCGPQAQGA